MIARLRADLKALMLIPGLSGHEERVAAWLRAELNALGLPKTGGGGEQRKPGDEDL